MDKFKSLKSFWDEFLRLSSSSKFMIFIVYGLFLSVFVSGLYQQIYKSADGRIKFHAVPIAISTLYQGHKHDYRGWLSTERPFQRVDGVLTNEFIKKQRKASVDKEGGHYYWVADDRGFADFVIGAFALFGPRMISLYFFWFFILFLSITLFMISFKKQAWAMAYLSFLLLGLHSAMSLLKWAYVNEPVFDPRYLEVLALTPVIHLIFVATFVETKNFSKYLPLLLGQVAIFVFLYHARSSLGWEALAVVLISLTFALIRRKWDKIKVPLGVAALLIMSITVLLSGYKHLTYHPNYFKEMGVRTFWHNALMGMQIKSMPPNLVCDKTAAELVVDYAKKTGCSSQMKDTSVQDFMNSFGCWGTANWVEYEYWAKKLYFELLLNNRSEVAKLYLYSKPYQTIHAVCFPSQILLSGKTAEQLPRQTMPWNPLHLFYLVPFLLIILGASRSLYVHKWKLLVISSFLFICGLVPPVLFYSAISNYGGMSVMKVVLLYFCIIISFSYAYSFTRICYKTFWLKLKARETH